MNIAFCAVEHCISEANGTDALEIGLPAPGVKSADKGTMVAGAGL